MRPAIRALSLLQPAVIADEIAPFDLVAAGAYGVKLGGDLGVVVESVGVTVSAVVHRLTLSI